MVILDLWGISFHPAVVVGLGNDLLFDSILAHCVFCPLNLGVIFLGPSPRLILNEIMKDR